MGWPPDLLNRLLEGLRPEANIDFSFPFPSLSYSCLLVYYSITGPEGVVEESLVELPLEDEKRLL